MTTSTSSDSWGRKSSRSQLSSAWQCSKLSISSTRSEVTTVEPAAAVNAAVDDATRRPSTRTTVRPAVTASSASRRSRVDLPTPPGPCRNSATNALGQPASADPKSARSAARPTKPRSRTACRRSASTPRPVPGAEFGPEFAGGGPAGAVLGGAVGEMFDAVLSARSARELGQAATAGVGG
jgi:hypothetical protein